MDTKPKFTIWLGDNWPGPYVVTFGSIESLDQVVVVNGVTSPADAVAVASAEFPGDHKSVSVRPARVAEASHHLGVLREQADYREQLELAAATKAKGNE